MKKFLSIFLAVILVSGCNSRFKPLPRGEASPEMKQAVASYIQAMDESGEDLHSIMVVQHGKVVAERQIAPDTAHFMMSVSKTFTSAAVGFAISEGLLGLDDRIVDIFPESVPEHPQENLSKVTLRHLLTMNSGHATDPTNEVWTSASGSKTDKDWIRHFMEWPIVYEPGTCFTYNSLGTYLLSAAVQKVSGKKVVDYLDSRLWKPLGIEKPRWDESPAGIDCGGWGLYLHTEDMARMGLCLLQDGKFMGKQVIPSQWAREMTTRKVDCSFAGINSREAAERGMNPEGNDWMQGYCYQMWRCTHNAVRADGAAGQFIIVIPEKDAVVVTTAQINNMFLELHKIWELIYPAL